MKLSLTLIPAVLFLSTSLYADSKVFRGLVGDAANIERDARDLSSALKSKTTSKEVLKAKSESLGSDILKLKNDVEAFEASNPNLTPRQKQDWELVKTKAQLLLVFYERKAEMLASGDWLKKRSMIRAYADGIAKRADMLQTTANRLDN